MSTERYELEALDANPIKKNKFVLDVNQLQSAPCRGNCGDSYAVCFLVNQNCEDWICSNFDKCNAGLVRVARGNPLPTCGVCGNSLKMYVRSN